MNTLLFLGNFGTGEILIIVLLLIVVLLLYTKPDKYPTWTGLIISLLTGTIVIYLVLCHFGLFGEERKRES